MTEAAEKNKVGKRYLCSTCGSEFIVTKASAAQEQPLSCHGQPMSPK